MSDHANKGDKVTWKWGKSKAEGTVQKTSTAKTTIQSKGKTITRNGDKDNKAVVIKQKGSTVLKRESELS